MMYSLWKTSACLVILRLVSAMDFPISSNYTLKSTTCTKAVYNKVVFDQGDACFLCFCQNSLEACWPRDRNLCGNQLRLPSQEPSSSGSPRVRRSPVSLSDIFFRDATREFFDKQIAEECKPFQSSFSDGCPPADWCVGCTVCDCDANGRWDCHILSFCNGDERKKVKVPLPGMPKRRVFHKNKLDRNKMIKKPKKVAKPKPKPQGKDQKRNQSTKKPNNSRKSSNNGAKPSNVRKKPINVTNKPNKLGKKPNNSAQKQVSKRGPIQKSRKIFKKPTTTRKPQKKKFLTKKPRQNRTKKPQLTTQPAQRVLKRKIIYLTTPKPQVQSKSSKRINPKNHLEESELGKKIIKKVMTTVHKIIGKQMEKLHNTTRVQRSIDSKKKDCQKKEKSDKKETKLKEYNLRKKKLKNIRPPYGFRKKRQALDLDLSIIEMNNANLLKDNPPGFEDLSINNNTTTNTQLDSDDSNKTTMRMTGILTIERSFTTERTALSNSSTTIDMYHKYSVDKNSSNSSLPTQLALTSGDVNKTSTDMNILDNTLIEKVKNTKERNVEKASQYAIIMSDPVFNDIKNKKWETLQILRDNVIKTNSVFNFNNTNKRVSNYSIDEPWIKQLKTMIRNKGIRRKLGVTHKHNLKRVITNNFKTATTDYFGNTLTPKHTSHNVSSLQTLLQNLMREMNSSSAKNSTAATRQMSSKFSLFKYLRSIFKNIFNRKKGNQLKSHKTNEGVTLQILCENIGECFFNEHNKIALRSKIHDLNAETEKIFKTIKVIKGLLYLIEMPVYNGNANKKPLNSDMLKLDAILKDTYAVNNSLTNTQAIQINYVKKNVNQFIQSVGKFATLLNEIIDVLYKNNKRYTCQRNLHLNHKKKKLNSFNKIKNLLIKYNIMQNTFMKNMYELLTDLEKNMTAKHLKPKESVKHINNTQVIERYSKNIVENLRKLKNLAQTLSSNRRKRQTTRDDDAIEYLLKLMEYLLKKNHPLDTAPENDGIDLLIEAIQNAPDVKLIKKKVLDDLPTTARATRTTNKYMRYFQEDSNPASNRISKEENQSIKNENILAIEQPVDTEEETTQVVYYKKFDDDITTVAYETTAANKYETTAKNVVKNISEKGKIEKTGFDRFESALDDTRRYEVFNTDSEDEPIIPIITTTDTVPTTITKVTAVKVEESTFVPILEYKLDDDPVTENRTKLDWIEENFGKEIREFREQTVPKTTISITHTTQATTLKPLDQNIDNLSSLTVEKEEEEKKKAKISADEVLYRKQIEFLNSLDYGTEKSEFDESEVKEEEKYSNDGFPLYFVR